MTDKLKKEIESAMEERKTILEDLDKEKESYAKYLISQKENIKNYFDHPYVVTKKDIRKKKMENFKNKLKKVFGL
jgi:hypothetical protein